MVHLGAHAVFCRLHGPCPGGIRRRYGSEAHDGAADARRTAGSTIRDSAARARDSAALAGTWTSAARPADSAVMQRIGSVATACALQDPSPHVEQSLDQGSRSV